MRVNVTLVLVVVVGAMVGPDGGKGDWFQDYMDEKDKGDLEAEGEALDLSVDDEGNG